MRTVSVTSRRGTTTIQTELSLAQAVETLRSSQGGFEQDLVRAYDQYGERLTAGRANWLLVLAQQSLDKAKIVSAKIELAGITALFNAASDHGLKYPKIRLQLEDGTPVIMSIIGGNSTHCGKISVSAGSFNSGAAFFGRIDQMGNFSGTNQEVIELLRSFAADPAGIASEYGKLVGSCCFCGLALTDERSLAVGYGPQCASHYSLPWGERPVQKMMDAVLQDVPAVQPMPISFEWLLERAPVYTDSYI